MKWYKTIMQFDWVLIASTFLLVGVGVAAIYSVDVVRHGGSVNGQKQLFALSLGTVLLVSAGLIANTFYRATATWWYVLGFLLLVGVLFFGADIRGTRGWFRFAGFHFQPVEFMKVGVILLFAKFASRQERYFKTLSFFLGSAVLVGVPMLLVLMQPDLGSAALLGFYWVGMMILLRVKWRYLAVLFVGVLIAAVLSWTFVLKPYQKDRLMTFTDPAHDPLGAGYNIQQSLIAIGSGRWFGKGLGYGSQSQLRFLPESQTDFIFALIAESFGFFGSLILIGFFMLLWYRLSRMITGAADDFGVLVAAGALILLVAQWFVNVGATVGLLPVTGIPMPLVSYGGSSLISVLLLLGIVQSVYVSSQRR